MVKLLLSLVVLLVPSFGFANDGIGPVKSFDIQFSGPQGEYISQGKSYHFDKSSGTLEANYSVNSSLELSYVDQSGTNWILEFTGYETGGFPSRSYSKVPRYGVGHEGPALSIDGDGRGCNISIGQFKIESIDYDIQSGSLNSIHISFEQFCEHQELGKSGSGLQGTVQVEFEPLKPGAQRTLNYTLDIQGYDCTFYKEESCQKDRNVGMTYEIEMPVSLEPQSTVVNGSWERMDFDHDGYLFGLKLSATQMNSNGNDTSTVSVELFLNGKPIQAMTQSDQGPLENFNNLTLVSAPMDIRGHHYKRYQFYLQRY